MSTQIKIDHRVNTNDATDHVLEKLTSEERTLVQRIRSQAKTRLSAAYKRSRTTTFGWWTW